jgi:tetratricopeptide (TPR) repeat protein
VSRSGSSSERVARPAEADTIVYPEDVAEAKSSALDRPQRLGRYVVLEILGVGGMGVVCAAYDPKLDRRVALKLLRDAATPEGTHATAGQARLIREAKALAKLSHPNIITVHDVDVADGKLFMAMEYVEGKTIHQWLDEKSRAWREILHVFVAAGLTHRDFKPSNVLIGNDGRVRVLDFGLATAREPEPEFLAELLNVRPAELTTVPSEDVMGVIGSTGDLKLTQAGRCVGTPGYMAPEQHMGLPVDAKSDQFSFGASLYEALYGHLPFTSDSDEAGFWAAVEGKLAEPRDTAVPPWIFRILEVSLAARPEDRWPSVDEMLAALEADPARRRRRIAAAVGGVAVMGLAAWAGAAALAPDASKCADGEHHLAGIWDPPTRDAIEGVFLGVDKAYAADTWTAVSLSLDAYRQQWVETYTDICEATHVHGEQSDQLLDVRMACLERGRSELRALSELFVAADADVVRNAVAATETLADLEACRELWEIPSRNALPDEPDAREKVDAVLAEVDRSAAQVGGGRYDDALVSAEAALKEAEAVGHAPTHCSAMLAVGIAQEKTRALEASRSTLESAIGCASDCGDGKTEARAWSHLIYVLGRELREPESALALRLAADAAARRAGGDRGTQANTALYVAVTLSELGRAEEAVAAGQEAVRLLEEVHGDRHSHTMNGHGALGAILGRAGRNEQAKAELRRALETTQHVLGKHHPEGAVYALNLGNVLKNEKDLAGARELYELALRIHLDSGEDDLKVAQVYAQLGQVEDALGEREKARASLERALEMLQSNPGAPPRNVVAALNNLGLLLLGAGDAAGALAKFERASLLVQTLDEQPQNARTAVFVCQALVALERWDDARTSCSEALALLERLDPEGPHLDIARDAVRLASDRLLQDAAGSRAPRTPPR